MKKCFLYHNACVLQIWKKTKIRDLNFPSQRYDFLVN
jgi:hypothetical protein